MYRHGDVLIAPIKKIPAEARPHPGAVVAHGEATGHSHRFEQPSAVALFQNGDQLFLQVLADSARIVHEEHHAIDIPQGSYRVWRQREYSPTAILTISD